jgi:Flp pilus assembly protein TadD
MLSPCLGQQTALRVQQQSVQHYETFYGGGNVMDSALHEQVVRMFQSAVEVNPNDAELHTVLGVLYHLSSSFDLAIQEFRRAVELRPGAWPAYARVGWRGAR